MVENGFQWSAPSWHVPLGLLSPSFLLSGRYTVRMLRDGQLATLTLKIQVTRVNNEAEGWKDPRPFISLSTHSSPGLTFSRLVYM